MKMVVAYIRHEAFEPIRADLLEAGFPSLSITEVKGSGRQKAITEHYRGSELAVHLRPKLKIECVVETKDVGIVKEVILRHARTGSVGDGKMFVLPVEEAVRIRTGEEGEAVLQAHEGDEVSVNGAAAPEARRGRDPRAAPPRAAPTWRWWAPCWPGTGSSGWRRSPPLTPARRWPWSCRAWGCPSRAGHATSATWAPALPAGAHSVPPR